MGLFAEQQMGRGKRPLAGFYAVWGIKSVVEDELAVVGRIRPEITIFAEPEADFWSKFSAYTEEKAYGCKRVDSNGAALGEARHVLAGLFVLFQHSVRQF